jgi:hypothetical protein
MKHPTLLFLALLSSLFLMRAMGADEDLAALAAVKREAAIQLGVQQGAMQMNALGAFISPDGLALVDLSSLALAAKPAIVTFDGTVLPLGKILGIFPDHELALVKFDHRPKTWLPLAPQEPALGETIALVALSQPDLRKSMVPPVIGPVMAKRRGTAANIRVRHYLPILSLGAGLSTEQQSCMNAGCFAINAQGRLVAIKNGIQMEGRQTLILLAPVTALAAQIDQMVKAGEAIPFPLPPARNPIDLAVLTEDFTRMDKARERGDQGAAQRILASLRQRFPDSPRLKTLAAGSSFGAGGKASSGGDEFRPLDPQDPIPEQVDQLLGRAMFLAGAKHDYPGAIRELNTALTLCPADEPQIPKTLGIFYMHLNQLDEAERYLQQALAAEPEVIGLVEALENILTRQSKFAEADKMTKRYYELGRIYRRK